MLTQTLHGVRSKIDVSIVSFSSLKLFYVNKFMNFDIYEQFNNRNICSLLVEISRRRLVLLKYLRSEYIFLVKSVFKYRSNIFLYKLLYLNKKCLFPAKNATQVFKILSCKVSNILRTC